MKKAILYAIIIATIMTTMSGCREKSEMKIVSPCLITSYYETRLSSVVPASDLFSSNHFEYPTLCIIYHTENTVSFDPSIKADNSWFLENYSAKYGDLSYNKEIEFVYGNIPKYNVHTSLIPKVSKIQIISSEDFDADHPAGTDLGDIIRYSGMSYYPFIKNGYKPTYGTKHEFETLCEADRIIIDELYYVAEENNLQRSVTPIFKYINEMTNEDMFLMPIHNANCFLTFMKLPDNNDIHVLSVIMAHDNGDVDQYQFIYDFNKYKKSNL